MKRFWDKVNKTSTCWIWTAKKDKLGYGHFKLDGKMKLAHRVSYTLSKDNPGDLCVLHKCDNPSCVNPDHLFLGTISDNNKDARDKGRHKFGFTVRASEENGNNKLMQADVDKIRELILEGKSNRYIAEIFSVHHSTISCIRTGKRWATGRMAESGIAADLKSEVSD